MRRVLTTCAALALTSGVASAGGVERSTQSVGILFEQGTYAELSFGYVEPSVSGVQLVPLGPFAAGASSGNMAGSYTTVGLAFKTALNEDLDLALVLDQPIGADVNYATGTGYAYGGFPAPLGLGGSTAEIDSSAVTAMLRYKLPSNFSVYGGVRVQRASGNVQLFNGYLMETTTETDYGWLAGVAYERPDIALRVALTYNSAITHDFSVQEGIGALAPSLPFSTEVPQSVNLEFQSGIAADTLLFGSVRWVDWSEFDITPVGYEAVTGSSLVSYDDDSVTYTLGVGRRFNDTWSGSIALAHEPSNGGFAGNLGPTDGFTAVQLAAVYTRDNMKITTGVRYTDVGDAQTQAPAPYPPGVAFGDFTDNSAIAVGVRVGFSF